MKNLFIYNERKHFRVRHLTDACGMHPGGGFVAWPDGRENNREKDREAGMRNVSRGGYRKGFVAWPEKKPG